MKLRQAILCLDCECLYVGECCPDCTSRAAYPIRKWIPPLEMIKRRTDEAIETTEGEILRGRLYD